MLNLVRDMWAAFWVGYREATRNDEPVQPVGRPWDRVESDLYKSP